MAHSDRIRQRVKHLIVETLSLEGTTPDMIDDELPLFGDGLGLDSADAMELVVALEREFGIRIHTHEVGLDAFSSVAALSRFVAGRIGAGEASHA